MPHTVRFPLFVLDSELDACGPKSQNNMAYTQQTQSNNRIESVHVHNITVIQTMYVCGVADDECEMTQAQKRESVKHY